MLQGGKEGRSSWRIKGWRRRMRKDCERKRGGYGEGGSEKGMGEVEKYEVGERKSIAKGTMNTFCT